MPRNVQVQNTFSGPLDLLLYLVKRDEIDIHDIPISHLTREYLLEIEKMGVDVEAGGEFVAMATVLTELKSRWLLPQTDENPENDEEDAMLDPREGLVKALLEYKQFKQVAGELEALAAEHAARYARRLPPPDFPRESIASGEEYNSLHLFAAFQKIAARVLAEKRRREIINEEVPTEIRIQQIETTVAARGQATFSSLLSDNPSRDELVGFFIAILELVRLKKIRARQAVDFSEIYLVPAPLPTATEDSAAKNAPSAATGHPLRMARIFSPVTPAGVIVSVPAPANRFAFPAAHIDASRRTGRLAAWIAQMPRGRLFAPVPVSAAATVPSAPDFPPPGGNIRSNQKPENPPCASPAAGSVNEEVPSVHTLPVPLPTVKLADVSSPTSGAVVSPVAETAECPRAAVSGTGHIATVFASLASPATASAAPCGNFTFPPLAPRKPLPLPPRRRGFLN